MTIENLEKELKSGQLQSLYLLYGEELYLLETNLKKIKTLFGECVKGINFIMIDEQNVSEIISDIVIYNNMQVKHMIHICLKSMALLLITRKIWNN